MTSPVAVPRNRPGEIVGVTTGPLPGSTLFCGCCLMRPAYHAVLCAEHEAEVVAPVEGVR